MVHVFAAKVGLESTVNTRAAPTIVLDMDTANKMDNVSVSMVTKASHAVSGLVLTTATTTARVLMANASARQGGLVKIVLKEIAHTIATTMEFVLLEECVDAWTDSRELPVRKDFVHMIVLEMDIVTRILEHAFARADLWERTVM